ncbi:unnamed protein product [Cuscuta campestris]|uniref:Retrotransposon Copia-like N-terminal domain-containing protein n=1 Tax=Cuscuta campestris TaxID=132261 RepID=A0A484KTF8_9ASTE|nr:unnamed protein product [Cuscuta campestris]
MILTTTKLTGTNFIPWSRSIKIALISKMKIGFINGMCRKPDTASPNCAQWERCDNMVFSWILNSIQPDLAEAFLYATSSQELWNELMERFGESNGPLIYQIEKKIADIRQNNDPVGVYFTKLKKLWDELTNVERQKSITGIQVLGSEMAAYAGSDAESQALYAGKGGGPRQNHFNKTDPKKTRRIGSKVLKERKDKMVMGITDLQQIPQHTPKTFNLTVLWMK